MRAPVERQAGGRARLQAGQDLEGQRLATGVEAEKLGGIAIERALHDRRPVDPRDTAVKGRCGDRWCRGQRGLELDGGGRPEREIAHRRDAEVDRGAGGQA